MPVHRCSNGKYRIGSGPCVYNTREAAERAYRGYLAKRGEQKRRRKGKRRSG